MSDDDHWQRLGVAVRRRVLGKTLFGLRLHAGAGSIPRELRLELLRQVITEVEAERDGVEKGPTSDG